SAPTAAAPYQSTPAGQQPVFPLDRLQAELETARAAVATASDEYSAALAKEQTLAARQQTLDDQAQAIPLLSDRLEAEKRVAQFGGGVQAAQAETDALKQRLDDAQATLNKLQEQAQGASF